MTNGDIASAIHGRAYGDEVTRELLIEAKREGCVIVFGASDDLIEFRGAIDDEGGAPGTVLVDAHGLLPDRDSIRGDEALEAFFIRRRAAKSLTSLWCKEEPYSFTYKTDIPHATFDIMEDGEKYCRGIVFNLADL